MLLVPKCAVWEPGREAILKRYESGFKTDWMWGEQGLPDLQTKALGEEWSHNKKHAGGATSCQVPVGYSGGTMQREETKASTLYLLSTNTQKYTPVS